MACAGLLALLQQSGTIAFRAPTPEEIAGSPTFAADERIVATHYFYWYRWPDEHFDQLRLHFPDERAVSYESPTWHRRQIEDALTAGIDVLLPVYWGAVDHYDKPDVAFSVRGLPALVEALDAVAQSARTPPRVGMFYDTTTLLNAVRGADPREGRAADLRTEQGRDVFYRTIRDFFRQVPPRHWAQIAGHPLIVLYGAGFAAGWDQRTFDELAERFSGDFGRRPFVVRDSSWTGVRTGASCAWGAALDGPHFGEGTVQIGPGYDDSPVRGRRTPIREREGGRFYEKSWRAALRSDARIALVETWNENHEGTSIAETVEHGRTYIELTARYAALFKRHEELSDDIELEWPEPRPRPDLSWGAEAQGRELVEWRAPDGGVGLRPIAWEDGPYEMVTSLDGGTVLRAARTGPGVTYVYFQISDSFAFAVDADFELEVSLRGEGDGAIEAQYDAHDDAGPFRGAYKSAAADRTSKDEWSTATFVLPHSRFANRQNGGADLRLCVTNGVLSIRSAILRRRR